ncbi:TetR/AcrR family transcriptional regulator [Nocardioides sp. R-C-SC26]|uniref:TetR/AcrR family transcriptional regulator n=1 Tax=Nocardioides sp. R-C-SC26 TaxID=2870414 RepID=UPI001E6552C6|nr:TetR/AcrR family transcriptional regulator [Nocardioides sp. R-C-SC26]
MATSTHRTEQRRQRGETRGRIVAAAEELLRTRRVRELSIEDVMEAAGLTRTAFYRHFDDLFDLVTRVAEPIFTDLLDLQRDTVAGATSIEARVRGGLEPLAISFAAHGPLMRAAHDATAYDDRAEAVVRTLVGRFTDLSARQIGVTDPSRRDAVRALVLMNVGYLLDCFGSGVSTTRADITRATDALTAVWLGAIDHLLGGEVPALR